MVSLEKAYQNLQTKGKAEPKLSLEEAYEQSSALTEQAGTLSGLGETAVRSAGNALTFGLGDELRAGIGAMVAFPFVEDRTVGELYDEALEAERLKSDIQEQVNPGIALTSEIATSIPTGMGLAKGASKIAPNAVKFFKEFGTKGGKALKVGADAAKAAALGGAGAATYGFGEGESGFEERLDNAIDVGLFGAALSGPLGALSPAFRKGGRFLKEKAAYLPMSRIISRGYDKARQALGKEPRDSAKVAGYNRASEYLQELVGDTESLVKKLDEDTGGMLTSQYLDDSGLLALQENLKVNNPVLANKIDDITSSVRQRQTSELERLQAMGDTKKTRQYLEGRLGAISDEIDGRLRMAADEAEIKTSKLGADVTEEEASSIARREIERAYNAVKAKEDKLWGSLPKSVKIPYSNAMKEYKNISKIKANTGILPSYVTNVLNKKGLWGGQSQPVTEIHTLSSRLKSDARSAMAEGKGSNARIYRNLAKALDEDISSQKGLFKGNIGEIYDTAVEFTAMKNDRFSKGVVGKLRGVAKEGGEKIPEELTLKTAIGSGGVKGGVQFDELLKAADSPEMRDSVKDYLLVDMQRKIVDGNEISPKKAQKYLRSNRALFEKFPDLQQGVIEASEASLKKGMIEARQKAFNSNLRRAKATEFLNSPVDEEFSKMLRSQNPISYANELVKQVRKDKSGESLKGLQSSVFKMISDKALSNQRELGGSFITQGDAVMDLVLGRGAQVNKKASAAIKKILSPEQVSNLKKLAIEMRKIDPNRKLQSLEEIGQSNPSVLTDLFAKVTGARLGAKLAPGGGSIQTAAIGSGFMSKLTKNLAQDQAKELLEEALFDPKLMKALLTNKNTSQAQVKRAEQILENWYKNFIIGQNVAIMEKYGVEQE